MQTTYLGLKVYGRKMDDCTYCSQAVDMFLPPGNDMVESRDRQGFDQEALLIEDFRHRNKSDSQDDVDGVQGREPGDLPLQGRWGAIEHIRVVEGHTCVRQRGLTS